MDFYKMLSDRYRDIFPLSSGLFSMVKDITPVDGRVLDIGSAKGDLIRALDGAGYDAHGLEYEAELADYMEKTVIGDMHNIAFPENFTDTLVCTGNTLAHVSNPEKLSVVLSEFARVMRRGGRAVVQILNYEMILKNRPASLPVIINGDLRFEREYHYEKDSIRFRGILSTSGGTASSEISLYPVTLGELRDSAERAGLMLENLYGGFDRSEFDSEKSLPLVALLRK